MRTILLVLVAGLAALAATAGASAHPVAGCATLHSGQLTVGTDNPGYPPVVRRQSAERLQVEGL